MILNFVLGLITGCIVAGALFFIFIMNRDDLVEQEREEWNDRKRTHE